MHNRCLRTTASLYAHILSPIAFVAFYALARYGHTREAYTLIDEDNLDLAFIFLGGAFLAEMLDLVLTRLLHHVVYGRNEDLAIVGRYMLENWSTLVVLVLGMWIWVPVWAYLRKEGLFRAGKSVW